MTVRRLATAAARRAAVYDNWLSDRRLSSAIAHHESGPVLVLSPHLDDAVLSCWSALTAASSVAVVNVFAGLPRAGFVTVWDRTCGARESRAQALERIVEDRAALELAGRAPVNLRFLEEQYRTWRPPPSFSRLDAAIARAVPAASVVLAPLGAQHADHRRIRCYGQALCAGGLPVRLYADLPYVAPLGWPHWVTGTPPRDRLDVDAYWEPWLRAVPEIEGPRAAHVRALDADEAAGKLEAMRRYGSQFPALDAGDLAVLSNPLVHPFEVFWDLVPRPRAAGAPAEAGDRLSATTSGR